MNGASPRHQAREKALQALYALECGENDAETIRLQVIADEKMSDKSLDYARFLFDQVSANLLWADEIISTYADNWKLERIAIIDRIILRIGILELEKSPDVPVKVVINEAVELAKTYSTDQSFGFVNGILDQYVKQTAALNARR